VPFGYCFVVPEKIPFKGFFKPAVFSLIVFAILPSELIVSVFGDSGMHTRAAVSTNSLPLGVSVEVDAIFELN
jgi:hypothetical protein